MSTDKQTDEQPSTTSKKPIIAGAVGLGVAGMLLLGLVVFNDDGRPEDQPEPDADLAAAVLNAGIDDEGGVGDDLIPEEPLDASDEASSVDESLDEAIDELIEDLDALNDDSDNDTDSQDDSGDETAVEAPVEVEPLGLRSFCADVRHQPPPGQETDAASGIWVRGEVYGLDGGWIYIEGSSLNNGEPTQVPVEGGAFEAPLGINSYGEHPLDRFELGGPDIGPIDLLPTLEDGPGSIFDVDADEGAAFGTDECYDFAPPEPLDAETEAQSDDDAAERSTDDLLDTWVSDFVAAHTASDTTALLETLHPAVFEAYGEQVCTDYVTDTTGSIASVAIVSSGEFTVFEFDTPDGPVPLADAIPFSAEITTPGGEVIANDGHIVIVDDSPTWLTRCGAE